MKQKKDTVKEAQKPKDSKPQPAPDGGAKKRFEQLLDDAVIGVKPKQTTC